MQVSSYNRKTQSCNLIKQSIEDKPCKTSSDCMDINLGCDLKTKTCKRSFYASCLEDSDCLTSFTCINQLCDCVCKSFFCIYFLIFHKKYFLRNKISGSFYQVAVISPGNFVAQCKELGLYGQACTEFSQCYGTLVCNIILAPGQLRN